MNEFDLIERLHRVISRGHTRLSRPGCVGIGDDAAVLTLESGKQLVVTTDTLVSGVHFPVETSPADIGYKALAVNLSDLAAMGAEPLWFFLAITLEQADIDWLDAFASAMGELAQHCGIELAGGDTTSGPLSITITALGAVDSGEALLRNTAGEGDLVVISGIPGMAALGLLQLQSGGLIGAGASMALKRPVPRLQLGRLLRRRASACIDVSDGLAADLGHVVKASGLAAEVWLDRLPRCAEMEALQPAECWNLQLGGGDDYELCFALPQALASELPALAEKAGVDLTVIGRLNEGAGIRFLKPDGTDFIPGRGGFNHFS